MHGCCIIGKRQANLLLLSFMVCVCAFVCVCVCVRLCKTMINKYCNCVATTLKPSPNCFCCLVLHKCKVWR